MTDELRRLISQLQQVARKWRWPWTDDPRVPILLALAETRDPEAIHAVIGTVLEDSPSGRAPVRAAGAMLDATPLSDLPALETRLRRRWRNGADWAQTSERDVARVFPESVPPLAPFALASWHPDGHVREAAVRGLATIRSGQEIPFLILRLNDWVDPVRTLADSILRSRLTQPYAEAWARSIPLLAGLGERQRHQSGDLLAQVLQMLAQPENAALLTDALTSEDRTTRRAAHRFALTARGDLAERAARVASGDRDLTIRRAAARALREGGIEAPDLALTFVHDSAKDVRREALFALAENGWPGASGAVQSSLLDPHASIREAARHLATQEASGDVAFAPIYRQALTEANTTSQLRGALGGLRETGTPEDAALALPHVEDSHARVRTEAIRTLLALDASRYAVQIASFADDPSSRVVRTVVRALASGALPGVDSEAALADLFARGEVFAQRHALGALADLENWTALPYLLRATCVDEVRHEALAHLQAWLYRQTRVFTTPGTAQLREIDEALTQAAGKALSPELAREVQAAVDRMAP